MPTGERDAYAELLDRIIKVDDQAIRNFRTTIKSILYEYRDVLEKYADRKGEINRYKLRKLMNEMDSVSNEYGEVLYEESASSVENATKIVVAFMAAEFGLRFISEPMRRSELEDSLRYNDGLSVRDRTVLIAGNLADKVRTEVRKGVYNGDSVNAIYSDISDLIDDEEWQSRRVISSEVNNTMRLQVGDVLAENGDVYCQFYESKLCTHKNHNKHRCHLLAKENRYGLGAGVFKLTDMEIYFPHPQCRGYIGRWSGSGDDD